MANREDLVVLVADKDMQMALEGILSRTRSIPIRPVRFQIYRHPERDPGCRGKGVEFLRGVQSRFAHALLLFDREGSGSGSVLRATMEAELESGLSQSGWGGRGRAIVIDPELEAWVWSDSPQVETTLGWTGASPSLRDWLHSEGFLGERSVKPRDPKTAYLAALKEKRIGRSASIFRELAETVSFDRCRDGAFRKLVATLREWFPPEP